MAINFKDIKQNFFYDYIRFWMILFLIIFLYIIKLIINHFYDISNITMNIENAVYVTSGVAINNKYVITSKNIVETGCINSLNGKQGQLYIVTESNIYQAVVAKKDAITNLALLRLKKAEDNLKYYAILQIDTPNQKINKRLITPIVFNKPGIFSFISSRVVGEKNNDFLIAVKNRFGKTKLNGFPVFSKNYILIGIIKEEEDEYIGKTSRDNILNNANIQKTFLVNNLDKIKNFLNNYNIEYSVISGNINVNNETYSPENSVVNIICIKN